MRVKQQRMKTFLPVLRRLQQGTYERDPTLRTGYLPNWLQEHPTCLQLLGLVADWVTVRGPNCHLNGLNRPSADPLQTRSSYKGVHGAKMKDKSDGVVLKDHLGR